MSPDIIRADLAILIAVGIVTELLSFILIKIEVHDVPFSVGVAKGEERDRLLQHGDNFHTSIVHCRFCEVHVNTMEGFWSLLRSWLRPHRGISQERLPFYLGFFEFVHNVRKRGKALLSSLIALLVSKDPGSQ